MKQVKKRLPCLRQETLLNSHNKSGEKAFTMETTASSNF